LTHRGRREYDVIHWRIVGLIVVTIKQVNKREEVFYFHISSLRRSPNVEAPSCCLSSDDLFGITHQAGQLRIPDHSGHSLLGEVN
jgi:hypothetical protein